MSVSAAHILIATIVGFAPTPHPLTSFLEIEKSVGVFSGDPSGNGATSISGATTLATGGPTTFSQLSAELMGCMVGLCDVYANIHTNYSFHFNPGAFGVARGQLHKTTCPAWASDAALCFAANITSANTNAVNNIPHQLPTGAASATTTVTWEPPYAETDFHFYADHVHLDTSLHGNQDIVGAHLHTGSATVNGPVNIVFCGGPPLPGLLFTKTKGVTNMACSMYEHTLGGWHTR
mmetsp:Transcript_29561/g.98056  ORF Transcript_29561/g.98056 Transcript_29561/m.98056 type:complete len:235 (-) Transcript_29561:325-1029(-)